MVQQHAGDYVLYERLPCARDTLGNYAAFTCMIPVAERSPEDVHHLTVAYEKAAGTVRWYVDEVAVYRVDKLGCEDAAGEPIRPCRRRGYSKWRSKP